MKKIAYVAALGGIISVSACVSQTEHSRLQIENDRLDSQLLAQTQELERLKVELNQAKAVADVHETTERVYQDWISELEEKVNSQDGLKINVNEQTGESQIQIENTLLFAPGEITISQKGLVSLADLADQLKTAPGILRIDGHTDDQPVKSAKTRQHSKDNWQLSVNRSLAVLRTLLNNGVPPEKLSVAGYGMYRPVENNGPKGNAANRRVEIVFIPDLLMTETKDEVIGTESSEMIEMPMIENDRVDIEANEEVEIITEPEVSEEDSLDDEEIELEEESEYLKQDTQKEHDTKTQDE